VAPTLFNLYTNDMPYIRCRKFAYDDDICCILARLNLVRAGMYSDRGRSPGDSVVPEMAGG